MWLTRLMSILPRRGSLRPATVRQGAEGRRGPREGSVKYRLDVVPVGIEHERRIVAAMVLALAGLAMVAAAGGYRGAMERFDLLRSARLEGQMNARYRAIGTIDPQLIGR